MSPPISIIMAVKNEETFLPQAVMSILNQTFSDFEFVIVDDKSTDKTWSYLAQLKDPRLKLFQNTGEGQTEGLNMALSLAQGEWIARMDGDDWCHSQRLERQYESAKENPRAVLISSDYVMCDENLRPVATMRLNSAKPQRVFQYLHTRNNPFCHPTVMFKRETAMHVGGYDPTLKNAQDYFLWKELLKRGEWCHVSEPLVHYRVRTQSLSILRSPEQGQELKRILGKATDAPINRFASLRVVSGLYAYKLGFAAWTDGRRPTAVRYLLKALACGVRPIRSLCLLFSTLFPRSFYMAVFGYRGIYR